MKEKTEIIKKIEPLIEFLLMTISVILFIIITGVYLGVPLSAALTIAAGLSGICIAVVLAGFTIGNSVNFFIELIKRRLKALVELILYAEQEPCKETFKDFYITCLSVAILTAIPAALVKINDELAAYVAVLIFFLILAPLLFVAIPLIIMQLTAGFMFELFRYEGSLLHKELRKEKRRIEELEARKTLENEESISNDNLDKHYRL